MGLSKCYAPGQGPVDPLVPIARKLTTNKAKMDALHRLRVNFPVVAMGGVSFGWVKAAVEACNVSLLRLYLIAVTVVTNVCAQCNLHRFI